MEMGLKSERNREKDWLRETSKSQEEPDLDGSLTKRPSQRGGFFLKERKAASTG